MYKFFIENDAILVMRMILAAVCGGFLGYERKHRGKSAGIRTHLVVATASALMMIVSKYGFTDMANILAEARFDPSRIAAGIVTGIGFLGAGMIYIHRTTPQGLTTAAGIWATSGIGMAIGSGLYVVGIAATLFIYLSQLILHKNLRIMRATKEETVSLIIEDSEEAVIYIRHLLEENDMQIENFSLKKLGDSTMELDFTVSTIEDLDISNLLMMVEDYDYIKQVKINNGN